MSALLDLHLDGRRLGRFFLLCFMERFLLLPYTVSPLPNRSGVDGRRLLSAGLRVVGGYIQTFSTLDFRLHSMKSVSAVPWTLEVGLSVLAFTSGAIKELIYQARSGLNDADGKLRLLHALQCRCKCAHVGDLAGHQELKRFFRSLVLSEADEAFINDFGPCFCCNVAAQIDSEVAGDFEVVRCPGVFPLSRTGILRRPQRWRQADQPQRLPVHLSWV